MNKDGTIYLALLRLHDGSARWELIHWDRPAAVTGLPDCWCNQCGLGLKFAEIERSILLDDAIWVDENPPGSSILNMI